MRYPLALALTDGVGNVNRRRLIETFGSARAVLETPSDRLLQAGFSERIVRAITSGESLSRADQVIGQCERSGIRILTPEMEGYPDALHECPDAPGALYVRGAVDFNHGKWLSIVGTRNATAEGLTACNRVVRDVAQQFPDAVVVSGLAFGIDKAAHAAALQHKIKTVAVMAGWVDDIVPRSHYYLARQILEAGGAIVSDMPPGTVIDRGNFLSRNRIIAGLSEATIVVESAIKGGSLVTADIAASYHKELFALPGSITDPTMEGTNMLIRSNKAILYQSAADMAQVLGWQREHAVPPTGPEQLSERLRKAYDAMPAEERLDVESLAELWDVPLWDAAGIVNQLRVKGLVALDPYKCYYKP